MNQPQKVLVIIDPQNDFCDLPQDFCPVDPLNPGTRMQPALPVTGAHADMLRIAALINAAGDQYDAIVVTLDTHGQNDVAHPAFWMSGDGGEVEAGTEILAEDVRSGRYLPRNLDELPLVLLMLDELETQGKYTLRIWPTHCEIGTWGANVHAAVRKAYNAWELRNNRRVITVSKGTNPFTEHYSAVRAEVPMEDDPSTQTNAALLRIVVDAEEVDITGEAASHCVKQTQEDMMAPVALSARSKFRLLTDCMSPVPGFEAQFAQFIQDARDQGVQIITSKNVLEAMYEGAGQ